MTEIYFIRHAESNTKNRNDVLRELTPKGLRDRELVTGFLVDKNIDAVLSSPYVRAVDTVKHFADSVGYTVETIDGFSERKVGSGWIKDYTTYCKRQWEDFSYKLPEGESLGEVQDRNIRTLNTVLDRFKNKRIVIGIHGTALSTIINYYDRSYGFEDFMKIISLMPWIIRLRFDEGKIQDIEAYDVFLR